MFCSFSIIGKVVKVNADFNFTLNRRCKASVVIEPSDGTDNETVTIRFNDIKQLSDFVNQVAYGEYFTFTGKGCVDTVQGECGYFEVDTFQPQACK